MVSLEVVERFCSDCGLSLHALDEGPRCVWCEGRVRLARWDEVHGAWDPARRRYVPTSEEGAV